MMAADGAQERALAVAARPIDEIEVFAAGVAGEPIAGALAQVALQLLVAAGRLVEEAVSTAGAGCPAAPGARWSRG